MPKTPKNLCSSQLRTKIWIESPPLEHPDGMGGFTGDWTLYDDPYAMVEPWKGREIVQADKLTSLVYYTFYVRFVLQKVYTEEMRVRFFDLMGKERIFNIRTIMDVDFKHQFFALGCEEGVVT